MSIRLGSSSTAVAACLAALMFRMEGQTPNILSANTGQLNVQMALDQSAYFPGEAAAVTITITNPSASALQVMQPFNNSTGCLVVYVQPPSGPPSPTSPDTNCNPFSDPYGVAAEIPTTIMSPGQQLQAAFNSYAPPFGPAISLPLAAGSYSLNYFAYSLAQIPFSVVAPHLDASGNVQLADESYVDPTTGATVQSPSFAILMALRSNGASYICVSTVPTATTTVVTDASGNLSGNPAPYKRIASGPNPVVSISGTTDGAGNLTIQWQDSTGAMFTGNFALQYDIATDIEPDGSGYVIAPGGASASPGAIVNLTAVPNFGYSFVNWTGATVASPSLAATSITMSNSYSVIANFVANGQTTPTNISAQVQSTTSGYGFAPPNVLRSITLTNTSGQYIGGPISVVLTNLTTGFTLTNATGTYNGSPYIRVLNVGALAPGQAYTTFLQFSVGPTALFSFTPVFYSGL